MPWPELMELLLHALLQIQFDRFPPENHNFCSLSTKAALTHQSKHGEVIGVTMGEGLTMKTLPLWCLKVLQAQIWDPQP